MEVSKADWSGVFQPVVSGAGFPVGVVGRPSLLSKGFERQAACQPHQFVGHRFKVFHQGPGRVETALSRVIFEVRCHVARRRGECEQQRTKFVSGFLDIVFRLEREFMIKIRQGELFPEPVFRRGTEIVRGGQVTDDGLAALRATALC